MAGITNHTARQFNLKGMSAEGARVTVRVARGLNVVDDAHWQTFVSKDGKKVDPYVAELEKKGFISFGKEEDDKELEKDPDTKSKSKSAPAPKPSKSK